MAHGGEGWIDERDRSVLHLAGGVSLGVDVAHLLHLQRALHRRRKREAAAEEEHVSYVGEAFSERRVRFLIGHDAGGGGR